MGEIRLDVNKMSNEDGKETDFLFGELDCEIPDDVLCNIPMPGDSHKASKTLTRSVLNNCTINIVQK